MNQRDYDGKAEEYLAECLRIEIEKKDAEIAALKAKYRDLENDYVATESIYEAICDMVTTGKEPSDFMMSFPSVREMWDAINSKDAEIAALKEKIKGLEELQYVYENTPFAHWMERTKKAEAYKSDVENAKYKAFWDDSRLADRQQWERYDWPKHQKEDSQ